MSTIGKRIKYLRKDVLGMTQQVFAELLGTKRGNIASYETDTNAPSDAVKSLICQKYNVRREWLEDGEEPMYKPEPVTPLGNLAVEYHLDEFDQTLVLEYMKLSADHRNIFKEYLRRVVERTAAADEPEDENDDYDLEAFIDSIPDTPEELEKMFPTFDAPPDLDKMG